MAMPTCTNLTYGQIWKEFKQADYYRVDENERWLIHRKWRALGKSVWKGTSFKP